MFESAGGLLTIDLKAIQSNYHRLCKELNGQDCSVVVKADAYGLGVEPVSKALWDAGARTFFVALPDEGVTLRHILPDADIHILGGLFKGAADVYTTHNLIPVLNSLEQVQNWQNRGRADIQVDTGMTRLGIAMKDIGHIPSGLQTDVLMTHFACADEQGHPLTSHQIEAFTLAVDKIGHKRASLCNSAGIFLGKKAHFDLGRPGCSLYGINPTPHTTNPMQNPVHLQGKVIQLHEIDTQHSVGYGATYQLHSGQKLATIAVGYADGYLRCLGSAATVYVDGQAAPVVGRVSMDAISVDVSGLECSEGQYVDIIGPDNTPDDLAKWAHTIGYEILTSLGNRYKRVYKGQGRTHTMNFLQPIGHYVLKFFGSVGRLVLFSLTALSHCIRPPFYPRAILRQMIEIGYFSLPVVGLTTIFAGMVLALQSYTGFSRFSAEGAIANVVVLSITRELGPVLAGLMVTGRIGASMAAELGTMRVTEQVDALTTLSTNPFKYLVVPRIIAGVTMLPILVLVGDIIGVLGGYLVAVYQLGFNASNYIQSTWEFTQNMDVISGLVKAAVFGFIITLMGCYHGYTSKGGAQGVGKATTDAVVSASILILCFNYLLTMMFFDK